MPKNEHQPHTRESIFRDNCGRFPQRPKILTEGDSWFDLPFPGRNIIDQFITHYSGEANWLRREHVGDEASEMFLTEAQLKRVEGMKGHDTQRPVLVESFNNYKFDLILISAGGNDIIGDEGWFFASLLTNYAGSDPKKYLKPERLEARLDMVLLAFDELIALRDDKQHGVPIITHGYDYAIPQPNGVKLVFPVTGPWMWPHLQHVHDDDVRRGIVRVLIDRLNERLKEFAEARDNFHYVDTRKSVAPETGPGGWLDEIHPGEIGFHRVAGKFVPLLRHCCPGRFQRDWPLGAD